MLKEPHTVAKSWTPGAAAEGRFIRLTPSASMLDPFEPLSATAFAALLGDIAPSTIRALEDDGAFFSILPPGQDSGRAYPRFQTWPEVVGEPLRQVLRILGRPDGGVAWGFFSSISRELEELTPVEVLSAKLVAERLVSNAARQLLAASHTLRLGAVVDAAQAFAFVRAG